MVGPANSPVVHRPEVLQELYDIPHLPDLAKIAGKSPTIVDLLIEARGQIERFFGRRGSPRLLLERDPEFGTEQVVVGIPIAEINDDMKRLSQFDEQWWVPFWAQEAAYVCITMDIK